MHLPTHIMAGWCLGSLLPLNARQRVCCMIAAAGLDLDGVSWLFGDAAFAEYHHKFHNLLVAGIGSILLCIYTRKKFLDFGVYLFLFHLHMGMDYVGSGFGWGIPYFWPWNMREYKCDFVWDLFSWQNLTAAGVLLIWTLAIAKGWRRTPLEALMPSLDRQLVQIFDKKSKI